MRHLILTWLTGLGLFSAMLPLDEPPVKGQSTDTDKSTSRDLTDDDTAPDATPLKLELKVSGSNAVLVAERDLSKAITEAASLKRRAKQAAKPVQAIQQEISNLEHRMLQAEQQLVVLNAQLANVQDVATNNRLVGAIDTIEGQLRLAHKNIEGLKEAENRARTELNNSREAYVEHILGMRKMADQMKEVYESGTKTPEIERQLKALIAESGKQLKFEPSSAFESSYRKLDEFEKAIHTEKVSLRRDGNTFYASVVINGKHTAEMIVDSGASLISLPWELAVTMGLEPKAGDKQILLSMADGRTIPGHLKTIDSVRVGTFTVEKVECAVLGREAVNAEPLLGMTFLGEFQFQLDAAESTLGMTEIEGDSSGSRRK